MSFKTALCITIAATILATSATAQSWSRIKTRDAFVAAVVGKTLSTGNWKAKINADGTGSGKTDRGKYVLNWVWDKGRYCRNFKFAKQDNPSGTICARISIAGDQVRFQNVSGDKRVSVWTAN